LSQEVFSMTGESDDQSRVPAPAEPRIRRRPFVPRDALGRDIPAAALPLASARSGVSNLYLLTLLSAVDGSLVLLAASGQLATLGGALTVGLTVVAGAGAWIAAQQAFGSRPRTQRDVRSLGILAVITVASTVASAAVGLRLGQSVTLHVLPKAAAVVLFLVAAEVGGWRLPRPARVPMPLWVTGAAGALEVASRWTL